MTSVQHHYFTVIKNISLTSPLLFWLGAVYSTSSLFFGRSFQICYVTNMLAIPQAEANV